MLAAEQDQGKDGGKGQGSPGWEEKGGPGFPLGNHAWAHLLRRQVCQHSSCWAKPLLVPSPAHLGSLTF